MNLDVNTTAPAEPASSLRFSDLEGPMTDVEQLTDIVADMIENFTDPLWKQVRTGGGGAMVLITEAELNRIVWMVNECAHRTRLCRERYFEILEASFDERRRAKQQVAA